MHGGAGRSGGYEPRVPGQIARIARREPGAYAACERVSLVSSFVTSVLAGRYCPIDASDASGMNLMDIRYVGVFRGLGVRTKSSLEMKDTRSEKLSQNILSIV